VDNLTYPQAPTYTVFNNTNTLPYPLFTDTNFLNSGQPTRRPAYLYGNILTASASPTFSEWPIAFGRAAFFWHWRAAVRDEMLNKATAELRRTVHAQFFATLPLAATSMMETRLMNSAIPPRTITDRALENQVRSS